MSKRRVRKPLQSSDPRAEVYKKVAGSKEIPDKVQELMNILTGIPGKKTAPENKGY